MRPTANGQSCVRYRRGIGGAVTRSASTVISSQSSAVQGLRESTVVEGRGRYVVGIERRLQGRATGRYAHSRCEMHEALTWASAM